MIGNFFIKKLLSIAILRKTEMLLKYETIVSFFWSLGKQFPPSKYESGKCPHNLVC